MMFPQKPAIPDHFHSFTDSRQQKDWLDLTSPWHNSIVSFSRNGV
jgi:hypothetical protein